MSDDPTVSVKWEDPWGEPTEGFLRFKETLTEVPAFPTNSPETAKHFRAPDGSVYDGSLLRGIYEMANMTALPSDIYVMSFPKTGTTWLQELVYVIGTDCDFQAAMNSELEERFPFMEWPAIGFKNLSPDVQCPRFIKTHLSYSNLPRSIREVKPKIAYIVRNPKDTAVSMYYFYSSLTEVGYLGTVDDFVDMFMRGDVIYGPYERHVLEMWERRHDPNILFITYEELQKDICGGISRIAEFLGKTLSEDDVKRVAHHCDFKQMAANKSTNYERWNREGFYANDECRFMRKGQTGNWKVHFNEETNRKMDNWIQEKFGQSGIEFQYE